MLLPGRPRLRLGGAAEKPWFPNEAGVREEEEEEEEEEELIAPRAEAAAAERPRRLLLFASLFSSAKWRGVVEKDW